MTASGFKPPTYQESRRSINPVLFIGMVLLALVLLGGGLACVLGMGPFAPGPTTSPAAASSPAPTSAASAPASADGGRTEEPTNLPSGSVEPTPTPDLGTPRPPNDDTERLLTHVPEGVRNSCSPGAFIEPVLALVNCTSGEEVAVYYALYANAADANEEYARSVRGAEIERESGLCYEESAEGTFTATSDRWPSEREYTLDSQLIGRYLCNEDGPPSITWTDDRLYILAVATSPTTDSDRLVSFWATEAGPIP